MYQKSAVRVVSFLTSQQTYKPKMFLIYEHIRYTNQQIIQSNSSQHNIAKLDKNNRIHFISQTKIKYQYYYKYIRKNFLVDEDITYDINGIRSMLQYEHIQNMIKYVLLNGTKHRQCGSILRHHNVLVPMRY